MVIKWIKDKEYIVATEKKKYAKKSQEKRIGSTIG